MNIFRIFLILFLALTFLGCNPIIPTTNITPTPELPIEKSSTPELSTQTPTLQPTPSPIPMPTATTFVPFAASTTVDHVNVRTNPGLLFAVNTNVKKDTTYVVVGKAPGDEWILVQSADNSKGWIFAQLLQSAQDLLSIPYVEPTDVQTIKGLIKDENGNPVSGINFSIEQGTGDNAIRNKVVTDSTGAFFAYMPAESSGEWVVSYTGISCKSNLMDDSCKCKNEVCGMAHPPVLNLQLPENKLLEYVWK